MEKCIFFLFVVRTVLQILLWERKPSFLCIEFMTDGELWLNNFHRIGVSIKTNHLTMLIGYPEKYLFCS